MKFSRATALAVLGAMAAEATADDCMCQPEPPQTVTVTSGTATETQTVTSAVTITNEVTAVATITQIVSATGGGPVVTGGTGSNGIENGQQGGSSVSSSAQATVTGGTGSNGISGGDNGSSGGSGGSGGQPGGNSDSSIIPPYTASSNGRSTSCDYADGKSTVYEYPAAAATAAGNYTCDNAIYSETEVIMTVILSLEVTSEVKEDVIIYKTVTETLSTEPTHTPAQPPAPVVPWTIPPSLGNSTYLPNQTYQFPVDNSTIPPPPQSTGSGQGRIHPIAVNVEGKFMYVSNNLNASIGETLLFDFQGTNISVFESTLESPCTPIPSGFRTGFNQTSSNTTVHLDRQMPINDLSPHYFFCGGGARTECTTETVFAVNVEVDDWSTLQETLKSNSTRQTVPPMIPALRKREPVVMPKHEPQIPGRRSLKWWS